MATSWEEVSEPFQPLSEVTTRKMNPRIIASSGKLVAVLWHQRGVNRHGERLNCEVLGLYQVRDGLLYRYCRRSRISAIEQYQIFGMTR